MIRRDIHLGESIPHWLLVSQIEHARLSKLLAQRCIPPFGHLLRGNDDTPQCDVMREVLEAILHHDDGWMDWETEPQFDIANHQPLSFRELSLRDSIAIWSRSITIAVAIGPLAAWMVAGHFSALLEASETDHDAPEALEWLSTISQRRTRWLADWLQNPALHTVALAEEALLWLQAFDVMSLWICCACPGAGERITRLPEGYDIAVDKALEMRIELAGGPGEITQGRVTVDPWRFDEREIAIESPAHVVPVSRYADSSELLAARKPHTLRWTLVPVEK